MQPKFKWQCPRRGCDTPFQFFNEEFMNEFIELHRVEHELKEKSGTLSGRWESDSSNISELEKVYPMLETRTPPTFWHLSNEDKSFLQGLKISC